MASILMIEARFYADIADELAAGALQALEAANAAVDRVDVPGAFEIPAVIAMAHKQQPDRYDGFVALGCVIRGETSHYDYVCGESARGLMDLSVHQGLAIGYGVLTVENRAQAWARARIGEGDKGGFTARACLRMVELKQRFSRA